MYIDSKEQIHILIVDFELYNKYVIIEIKIILKNVHINNSVLSLTSHTSKNISLGISNISIYLGLYSIQFVILIYCKHIYLWNVFC